MLVLGAAMMAAGCGRKDDAGAPPPSAPTTATQEITTATEPGNPVGGPPLPTVAPVTAAPTNGLSFLQQLNRATLPFTMQNHRNPATVEELAAYAGVQLPSPPAGKKYAFNGRGLVVLVDASTK